MQPEVGLITIKGYKMNISLKNFLGLWMMIFSLCSVSAFASERATAEEAVAFVKKAVAYVKANGKEKAFEEFSNTKGQFIDRNLYIFVYDLNGVNLAIGNGNSKKMVGKNLIEMKDANGVFLIKKLIEIANTKGSGWVDYQWPNPATQAIEAKSSYVEKSGDFLIGAGIYK
jgi:cytochrome c